MTTFTLEFKKGSYPAGQITIICLEPLAMAVAKNIRFGDMVVVEGYIHQEKWWFNEGTCEDAVRLIVYGLLKFEPLPREEQPI